MNWDLDNIYTPVDATALEGLLKQSNYDAVKTRKLIDGCVNGFSIGYEGPEDVQIRSKNLKFRGVGNKTILWNKVMKEVKLKRYAGPFEQVPFKNFIQSPIGLVPKDNGCNTRLIFHLSYPRGKGISVNANTPKDLCTVVYPSFDDTVRLCHKAGINCSAAKSDMTSAFCHLGILRRHWKYLVMMAESPIDSKIYHFIDKCLPLGASISCAHSQEFSNAVAHIVRFRTKKDLLNYLDDFLFVALLKALCDKQVSTFLDICKTINFPVSLEKTFWDHM